MQLQSRRSHQHRKHHFLSTRPRADAESRRAPASRPHEARSAFARGRGAERRGPPASSRRADHAVRLLLHPQQWPAARRSSRKAGRSPSTARSKRELTFTVAELSEKFERVTITAVLECAGNGRARFRRAHVRREMAFRRGRLRAVDGVRLADVLRAAGVKRSAVYYRPSQSGRASGSAQGAPRSRAVCRSRRRSRKRL